jgi:hypothetical protein
MAEALGAVALIMVGSVLVEHLILSARRPRDDAPAER